MSSPNSFLLMAYLVYNSKLYFGIQIMWFHKVVCRGKSTAILLSEATFIENFLDPNFSLLFSLYWNGDLLFQDKLEMILLNRVHGKWQPPKGKHKHVSWLPPFKIMCNVFGNLD